MTILQLMYEPERAVALRATVMNTNEKFTEVELFWFPCSSVWWGEVTVLLSGFVSILMSILKKKRREGVCLCLLVC